MNERPTRPRPTNARYPSKDDAKRLASKYGLDGVIIIAVRAEESDFCVTSYGRDRGFCDAMARLGRVLSDGVIAWTERIMDEARGQ